LQTLLENSNAEELAEALNVGKSIVSDHLHAIGKIKKEDKWFPHELSELIIRNRLTIRTSFLSRHKRESSFCIKL